MAEKVKKLVLEIEGTEYAFEGGSDAGGTWESEEGVAVAVGGIKAGDKLTGLDAIEIFDKMLNPHQLPVVNISASPNTTTYEVGATANVTITATLTKKTAEITAAKITKNGTDLKSATSQELTAKSFNSGAQAITSDTTFSAKVSDATGEASGNSIAISFKHKFYYGVASLPAGDIDSAFVLSLANKNFATGYKGTYSVNVGVNQYAFFACPASWNIPNIAKIGGFDTELVDCGTIDFTNASGNTTSFKIVRTGQANLGAIKVLFE